MSSDNSSTTSDNTDWGDSVNEEAGAAKLWSVYVNEAEKYDKSLVESWRSNMDGMLIFAGLFSASLTAFIVESYKMLVADSGDGTVQLLSQISLQLLASSNGTVFNAPAPTPFKAPTSALVCNALWFISLGLSLACALVATLLEQWAREFLHRADMRSAPVVRARMYSFLYYGMRRFRMHTVVDVIPSLLHASLIFFFAGLVAFLLPLNKIIAAIVAAILAVFICVYIILTVLPIIQADSPYRTPLSNAVWGVLRSAVRRFLLYRPFRDSWQQRWWNFFDYPVISDNVARAALARTNGRKERDLRSISWTFKSISDPAELETFVEAIPDAMWGPHTRHPTYTFYFHTLRDSGSVDLALGISGLLRTCNDGLLAPEKQQRRQISCLKAIWALTSIPSAPALVPGHLPSSIRHLPDILFQAFSEDTIVSYYALSAEAMLHWSAIHWLQKYLNDCTHHLGEMRNINSHRFIPISQYLSTVQVQIILRSSSSKEAQNLADAARASAPAEFTRLAEELCSRLSHGVLFHYLRCIVAQAILPYRWKETLLTILPAHLKRFLPLRELEEVERILALAFSAPSRLGKSDVAASIIAPVVQELCFLWRPEEPRPIPPAIIAHLTSLKDLRAADHLFLGTPLSFYLWPSLILTLRAALPSPTTSEDHEDSYPCTLDEILDAIWLTARCGTLGPGEEASRSLLDAIFASESPLVDTVVAVVQTVVLKTIYEDRVQLHEGSYFLSLLKNHLPPNFRPADTQALNPPAAAFFDPDLFAARISVLAEFLDSLAAGSVLLPVPHRAKETIAWIGKIRPLHLIHDTYQLRFARSLRHFCEPPSLDEPLRRELMSSVINADIFMPYGLDTFSVGYTSWLQNTAAVEDVRLAMVEYRGVLSPSPELTRVRKIIHDLEAQSTREQPSSYLLPVELPDTS
ncbi:hypothetical protein C8F01DRAFT_1156833 [Mycena amicta]|nr:hypothetical protein C8F01DRAFT_1156833 [Mycena amicta]